jgi:hypothetical protein
VVEHKEEEEFYVFMARTKDSKNGVVDWYIICYVNFVGDKSQSNSVVLSGAEEYKVRGNGNVVPQLRGKKVMIKDVYYDPHLEKNLISISSIMKHSPHLDKKMVAMGVEEKVYSGC